MNSSPKFFAALLWSNFLSRFPLSNLAAPQFRFSAHDDLTPDLNSCQTRSDAESLNSQRSSSSGLFAFGNTAEAAKPPEMHHIGKSLALILPASFQIGIQYLLFPKINFSSKFRSAAARMAPSHLGALLKLRNLRKCIISKFLASIHTTFLVLAEMQNIPLIMRKLPVWCGTRSCQLKIICCASRESGPIPG